jgi:hypothetical protein
MCQRWWEIASNSASALFQMNSNLAHNSKLFKFVSLLVDFGTIASQSQSKSRTKLLYGVSTESNLIQNETRWHGYDRLCPN